MFNDDLSGGIMYADERFQSELEFYKIVKAYSKFFFTEIEKNEMDKEVLYKLLERIAFKLDGLDKHTVEQVLIIIQQMDVDSGYRKIVFDQVEPDRKDGQLYKQSVIEIGISNIRDAQLTEYNGMYSLQEMPIDYKNVGALQDSLISKQRARIQLFNTIAQIYPDIIKDLYCNVFSELLKADGDLIAYDYSYNNWLMCYDIPQMDWFNSSVLYTFILSRLLNSRIVIILSPVPISVEEYSVLLLPPYEINFQWDPITMSEKDIKIKKKEINDEMTRRIELTKKNINEYMQIDKKEKRAFETRDKGHSTDDKMRWFVNRHFGKMTLSDIGKMEVENYVYMEGNSVIHRGIDSVKKKIGWCE